MVNNIAFNKNYYYYVFLIAVAFGCSFALNFFDIHESKRRVLKRCQTSGVRKYTRDNEKVSHSLNLFFSFFSLCYAGKNTGVD